MMGFEVLLTVQEMRMAALVGFERHIQSLNRKNAHGLDESVNGLVLHIEGALGELAVAKSLNRYWAGSVNTFKEADIGSNIQVRWRARHDFDLLIRDEDDDDQFFFLVTGAIPCLVVHGWMQGRDAKKPEYLKSHGGRPPAYFVPKDKLSVKGLRAVA